MVLLPLFVLWLFCICLPLRMFFIYCFLLIVVTIQEDYQLSRCLNNELPSLLFFLSSLRLSDHSPAITMCLIEWEDAIWRWGHLPPKAHPSSPNVWLWYGHIRKRDFAVAIKGLKVITPWILQVESAWLFTVVHKQRPLWRETVEEELAMLVGSKGQIQGATA